ncbi:thioredoxin family protein [Marivirga arenosa]|uniref:Thioredoxin family protein n=1 Tax=Marivirga arenosa TaxID=3059076 RepID=A0AA49GE86_9BACT|nr:thioredoxin family protein [Marivirga sp. BKB1-2]WKK79971.1 thioredoxin family protein [Marivirga sp. BKB1-2]
MTETIQEEKEKVFSQALNYTEYRALIKSLLADNKTTGANHSDAMIGYTLMNDKRMDRLDKTLSLADEIIQKVKKLDRMNWLVITEAWCGDAAQNIPLIAKMADLNDNIDLRFIMRDENPQIMDQYLTNGSRSIPIIIFMDEHYRDLSTWGPRPQPVQNMILDAKNNPDTEQAKLIEKLHKWYAVDKCKTLMEEYNNIINNF